MKKSLAFITAVVLTFSLSACSQEDDSTVSRPTFNESEPVIPVTKRDSVNVIADDSATVTEQSEQTEQTTQNAVTTAETPQQPPTKQLNWKVEPQFRYDYVSFCGCKTLSGRGEYDFFTSDTYYSNEHINSNTGKLSSDEHPPSGGWQYEALVYDPVREMFGFGGNLDWGGENMNIRPISEFYDFFWDNSFYEEVYYGKIIVVAEVDSTKKEKDEMWGVELLSQAAYTGKYALLYDGKLVTDFIYDGYIGYHFYAKSSATVKIGNQYGIVDKNGDTLVPFELDAIVRIDNDTAFAEKGGLWGILYV